MILLNNKEVKVTKFPNGESLIDTSLLNELSELKSLKSPELYLTLRFESNEDILNLIFIKRHIDSLKNRSVSLVMDYMPYSRMDRSQNGSCFTLRYLCEILNNYFPNIYVVEPHSDVTVLEMADDSYVQTISIILELCHKILNKHPEIDAICFPDKGARHRYGDMYYFKEIGLNICYCDKVRDFDTGNIIGLDLCDFPENTKNVLILDDLCSKGGTFYHTANKLKENGVENVYLGVCHMETAVLGGELIKDSSPIKYIYCTNSMNDKEKLENIEVGFHPIYGAIIDKTNITCYDLNEFSEYKGIK